MLLAIGAGVVWWLAGSSPRGGDAYGGVRARVCGQG